LTPAEITRGINEAAIKTVCGFMNSEGGTLLVGVDDENNILGLDLDMKARGAKNIDEYELRLIRLLTDSLGRPNVAEFVRTSFSSINSNNICRIDVRPSTAPVFSGKEKFYVRVSNATNSLLPSETLQYCLSHWGY
jgi:predicted HTH transcriptional regulator